MVLAVPKKKKGRKEERMKEPRLIHRDQIDPEQPRS